MIYDVTHRTTYEHGETVDLAHHVLCLTPRTFEYQRVKHVSLHAVPGGETNSLTDHFGNTVTYLTIDEPHEEFVVELQAEVEVVDRPKVDLTATPPWEKVRDALAGDGFPAPVEESEFIHPTAQTPSLGALRSYAATSFTAARPLLAAVRDLTRRINTDFKFDPTATLVTTPLAEMFAERRGVCQDFAHLQIACLRGFGLAARYVSGYIQTLDKDGKPNLVGGDASHAWVAVYCPGLGWIEFDPTNDLMVGGQHVVLAWGRDYGDVSPTRGIILGGGRHQIDVAVRLVPVPA